MATITVINQKTRLEPATTNLELAIRESVRMRCRVQLTNLSREFFDAADDFLFSCGSKGQFTENSNYLKAMRELRTKQSLFDEAFLELASYTLFSGSTDSSHSDRDYANHLVARHAEIYAMLEVDLALQAMQRKADRHLLTLSQQMDALLTRVSYSSNSVPCRFIPVATGLWAFGEAQRVFALPLEIRLVVIKLFEQQFLLQMEKLFLDVIGIVKQALVNGEVDRGLLAVSVRPRNSDNINLQRSRHSDQGRAVPFTGNSTQTVEYAIDSAMVSCFSLSSMPPFVAELLRSKWRTVLFLIGMHRGCFGEEWCEAVATMQLLADSSSGKTKITEQVLEDLVEHLHNGFALLQQPETELVQFAQQLRSRIQQLAILNSSKKLQRGVASAPCVVAESSLSPSGKKILDNADLEEITTLLGTEGVEVSKSAMENKLISCLPAIDRLKEDVVVEFKIDGSFQACSLQRSAAKAGMFNITGCHLKTTITRSRLGLAISLHEGELKLPDAATQSISSQITVIDSSSSRISS